MLPSDLQLSQKKVFMNQKNHPFLPPDFVIPEKLENEQFRVRMLTVNDVVKDYEAVMTSIDRIRGTFGPDSDWPSPDLTLEQDLIDLGWHQKEFQRRSSFAYTVMTQDEDQCLGCVYIYPSNKKDFEAEIYLWIRESAFREGLETLLYKNIKLWLENDWPFRKVAYPGREISWEQWVDIKQ
jgi:hypothetical protein